ncbi:calmodulin-like [Agrilus planipennis]|uniref:Calmodulin-like n=1 Tax=Agrilus planipennis TaxID=224129 RepID=A0A1W4WWZ9_AGRPL|nr:calmodulin-like [Agrilus planipennis]
MADQLSDQDIARFKEAFSLFDRAGRGKIPAEELGTVMRVLGKIPSEAQINEFIKEVEGDQTGYVDFPDFLTIITRDIKDRYWDEEEVREAFRLFDKNETGAISVEDFRHILVHLGEDMTDEVIDEMIADAGSDNDGFINYEQFVSIITANDMPTYNYLKPQTCPEPNNKF